MVERNPGEDSLLAQHQSRLSRRHMLRVGGAGVALATGGSVLAACNRESDSSENAASPGYSKDNKYVLVALLSADPFWNDIKTGANDAADVLGVTFEFTGPQAFDTAAQVSTAQQIIGTRPEGMILPAFSADAMPDVIDQAVEAGIAVVCIDSDAPKSKRQAYVGTDHYELGRILGQRLVDVTGGDGVVGIATVPGQVNLDRRIDGIKDVLAAHSGMTIKATVDNQGDESRNATVVASMLQANPEINAVANVNAASAGVAAALRETNKIGKVKAVTSDINEPIANAIRQGSIESTLVQRTYMEGFYGVQFLALLTHQTSFMQQQTENGVSPLPENFDTGVIVVDKSNVDAFS